MELALFVGVGAMDDLAAPGTGLGAPPFDELLEALEVALNPAGYYAEDAARLLLNVFWLIVHVDLELCVALVDGFENYRARIHGAAFAFPGKDFVRDLASDPRIPFFSSATNLGDPVQPLVAQLLYFSDSLHELRKILELRPLVVNGLEGCFDLDPLVYTHVTPPVNSM